MPKPEEDVQGGAERVKRLDLGVAAALTALTVFVYHSAWGHEFVDFDDYEYVVENPHVRTGLSFENLTWAFTRFHSSNYHPLTWVSLMIDATLSGSSPTGKLDPRLFHLTSALLHLGSVLLVYRLFQRMTGAVWPSGLIAALFAIHPMHVESVAWVSERKDVLSILLGLAALLLFETYARSGRWRPYCVSIAFYLLSLLAKQTLVTLPAILLLLDYWPLARLRRGQETSDGGDRYSPRPLRFLLVEKIPFALLSVAFSLAVYWAQAERSIRPLEEYSLGVRGANAAISVVHYIGLTAWPTGLACFYPHPGGSLSVSLAAVSATVLVATTALLHGERKSFPFLIVGWLWFLIGLLPVCGLIQIGEQAMADRYSYFPHLGLFAMAAFSLQRLAKAKPRWTRAIGVGAAIALVALAVVAERQVERWRDTETLFRHTLTVTTNNYYAHNVLGGALTRKGEVDKALEQFRLAYKIKPDNAIMAANLANALTAAGRSRDAADLYRRSLAERPGVPWRMNNLAWILATSRDPSVRDGAEALRLAKLACESDGGENPFYLDTLAAAYAELGRYDDALATIQKARELASVQGQGDLTPLLDHREKQFRERKPIRQ